MINYLNTISTYYIYLFNGVLLYSSIVNIYNNFVDPRIIFLIFWVCCITLPALLVFYLKQSQNILTISGISISLLFISQIVVFVTNLTSQSPARILSAYEGVPMMIPTLLYLFFVLKKLKPLSPIKFIKY